MLLWKHVPHAAFLGPTAFTQEAPVSTCKAPRIASFLSAALLVTFLKHGQKHINTFKLPPPALDSLKSTEGSFFHVPPNNCHPSSNQLKFQIQQALIGCKGPERVRHKTRTTSPTILHSRPDLSAFSFESQLDSFEDAWKADVFRGDVAHGSQHCHTALK